MRSRTVREGSVGLLILLGLGLFAGLILWLRGLSVGSRSYKIVIEFANIAGMQAGAPIRYRGVTVGKVTQTRPGPNGVEVEAEISPADLVMPRGLTIEANQSGLLGATSIDITPVKQLTVAVNAKPLDPNCNEQVIVCNKSRLQGQVGVSVDELIRSSIRFANVYSDPQFIKNVNAVTKNSAEAAAELTKLSRQFGTVARSLNQQIPTLAGAARSVSQTANQLGLTAGQVNSLIAANRSTLVDTLTNINQLTLQLRTTVAGLSPVLNRVQQGDLLRNLELLSANAAAASTNFRDVSQALNSPSNLLVLQQTLDSARATFQNAQKITADLDELTGDPAFRNNLRNLVNGLSGLVSSTQQLHQQAQYAQILAPLATAANESASQPAAVQIPPPEKPAEVPAASAQSAAEPKAELPN